MGLWSAALFGMTGVLLAVGRSRRGALLLAVACAGSVSGVLAAGRAMATMTTAIPEGRHTLTAAVITDPVDSRFGAETFTVEPTHLGAADGWVAWDGPRLIVTTNESVDVAAGERVVIKGRLTTSPGWYRGDPIAGRLSDAVILAVGPPHDPLFLAGNGVRDRIQSGLAPFDGRASAALLAGFLIGDVRDLPDADSEALRRSGLSHFVAVSGSNVALFLAGWWLLTAPVTPGPRSRSAVGLAGLALFLVVTRWEPSVVRASAMAAMVLGARMSGFALDGWAALGSAVTALLLVSGDLAGDVGFQLSVAATAGVLAGAGMWADRGPRWAWAALGATVSAQIAVAPILLMVFGTVPVAAPLANVVAAPLVAWATAIGGIGVLAGFEPMTGTGLMGAEAVLAIARSSADLPHLGPTAALGCGLIGAAALHPRLRPAAVMAGAVALAMIALPGGPGPPDGPELTVLDVGQGDSVLLRGPEGEVVLIDGGPDAALLRSALRSRGVRRIDLLIVTHLHADHTTGLVGITEFVNVERVWHPEQEGEGGAFDDLIAGAEAAGVVVEVPEAGWVAEIGSLRLEVLGPLRRYASPNDGSLVIRVVAGGHTALLVGDIETFAQHDLGPLPADVLKVPHQGAATSDLDWLAASAPSVAVISVGPNTFGHPSPEVIEVLERAGARVM
ncbi:ComEC/Rec2 family competence protein, partial [bacterium]|nr:ComEC/Rec2 family competence protein [bacterium]